MRKGIGIRDKSIWKRLVGLMGHFDGARRRVTHGKDDGFVDARFVHDLNDAFGGVFGAFFVAMFEVAVGVDNHMLSALR